MTLDDSTDVWIERVVAVLLSSGPRAVTLDEVGEAIGTRAVDAREVELLFACLEERGGSLIEEHDGALVPLLQKVLATARALRQEGEKPSPTKIAKESGLSARAVRVALLYAEVIKG